MATWVAPIASQTDPDAPLTSELGKRWDNNVIAMAEGASGAPKIAVSTASGSGSGVPVVFSGLDDFDGITIFGHINNTVGAPNTLTFEISTNGTTWTDLTTLITTSSSVGTGSFTLTFFFPDGDLDCTYSTVDSASRTTATLAGSSSAITHVRLSGTIGQISAHIFPNGGKSAS